MDYIISFFTTTIVPILAFFGISFSVPEVVMPGNIPDVQTIETATQNAINEFTQTFFNGGETEGEGVGEVQGEAGEGEISGQ